MAERPADVRCDEPAPAAVLGTVMADGTRQAGGQGFGLPLDSITLERARRGDMRAFEAIYAAYGKACYNLALRILGEPAAAEDIVQDVFLKLMDTIGGFRGDAPFGAWLKRMAANATIDRLRLDRRQGIDDPDALFATLGAADPPADAVVDAWTLLQRLPARARAVIVLHQMEGYTHRELAELFGQTESYSKSVLSRALQRLHATLEDSSGTPVVTPVIRHV